MKNIPFHLVSIFTLLFVYKSTAQVTDSIPAHENFNLKSKFLNETRVINVWTPTAYLSGGSFPVLYMPDGGIQEDFPHVANTIAKLVAAGKIPPFILVGIENTQRRRDLTGPTKNPKDKEIAAVVGGSAAFRAFIKDELFQEINKRYRTTTKKGILGESLAGLFVVETFLMHPDMFDSYIAFDPSLWWNDQHLIKTAKEHFNKFPASKKVLWFAGSNTAGISENTALLSQLLSDQKRKNIKWKYVPEPNEQHETIFRATEEQALIWAWSK